MRANNSEWTWVQRAAELKLESIDLEPATAEDSETRQ